MTQIGEDKIEFAKKAGKAFEKEGVYTFTENGEIEEFEYFAVKWGLGDDCVLVFRIGDEPIIFKQFIKKGTENG